MTFGICSAQDRHNGECWAVSIKCWLMKMIVMKQAKSEKLLYAFRRHSVLADTVIGRHACTRILAIL